MPPLPKSRLGIALGSGAARGWAHLGALRALDRLGIKPDVVCGTSMGALAGGFYLSGHLDALEDWALRLNKLKILRFMDFSLAGSGLIGGQRLIAEMQSVLGDCRIEDLPGPYASVVTDLQTGHEVWLTEGSLVEAMRASFSLPAFLDSYKVDGRWVVDGALVNPVPVSVCHALGARVVIAINLNANPQSRNGTAPISASAGLGGAIGWTGALLRKTRGKSQLLDAAGEAEEAGAPNRIGVLASTLNIVQDRVTRSRLAADPPDVHIVPRVGKIGLFDFHLAKEAIAAGEAAVYDSETLIRDAMDMFEALG